MERRFIDVRLATVGRTLSAGLLLAAGLARADTNFVTVQTETVTNQCVAYAQVEPIAALPLRAVEAGQIIKLEIVPGTMVQAGQKLAELGGPEIQALLAQNEAAVSSARTNLLSAQKSLAIERQQLASHLVTQQMVLQAEGATAQAQAAFDTAQAQLKSLRQTITLTAPANGAVLAVNAAEGQRVNVGETVLMLQPADKLWLKASYYGVDAAAIHAGMSGQFSPASGGEPIPVKVTTVFGALNPDGGESVGLLADTPTPGWLNGESGKLTLNGVARSLVVVPTRALILDQGQWWVLVHTDQGDHPQAVTPGPVRGWQTFIERGLKPGAEVVAENAYLEFHRGISKNYQPPD
ncbi:MAG TPA: efflux RND transporter periplasmic adaptor subunit [Verrucomicrobiae bacterium]|nr:efflux RND transporter periplasmic adaptor subunit [Verrucomicrobiae bacterium]